MDKRMMTWISHRANQVFLFIIYLINDRATGAIGFGLRRI